MSKLEIHASKANIRISAEGRVAVIVGTALSALIIFGGIHQFLT